MPTSGEQRTDGRSPSARRKKLQPSVGLLARESQLADFAICGHPTLPRPLVEWVREGGLHLQWRDRAGFDRLPCYAQLGTEGTYSVFKLRLLQPSRAGGVKRPPESRGGIYRRLTGTARSNNSPLRAGALSFGSGLKREPGGNSGAAPQR